MRQLFIRARGLGDWQNRLADPALHWKRGRSAFELAVSWELATRTASGLPDEIKTLLDHHNRLRDAKVLFAVPEHQVTLEGTGKASCTDLWALLHTPTEMISMAVEGKAGEKFGDTIGVWLQAGTGENSQANRQSRLDSLLSILNLSVPVKGELRYQLLHRAASAILEAGRTGASQAILLVQSFSQSAVGFSDFQDFGAELGAAVQQDHLVAARPINGLPLWLGWINCNLATDAQIARVA